jgi:hypothetical protein
VGAYFIAPSFSSSNASTLGDKTMKLTGNDSAVIAASGDTPGYIRLISNALGTNPTWKYGSAFLSRRIYSETGFSAMFDMYMGAKSANLASLADGWSFIIAADTNGVTKGSGSLGYEGGPSGPFGRSVAFKVDTYNNTSNQKVPFAGYAQQGNLFSEIAGNSDGDGVTTRALSYVDSAFTQYVTDIHCYSWVDYESKSNSLKFFVSSKPTKPSTATLAVAADIESIIGNEYYIGFTAASGAVAQEYDLRQFYVLNNYVPTGLAFSADGTGIDPSIPIIEDFTAPSAPVITQVGNTFTVGYSTDDGDKSVAKYQYRISSNSGANWIDASTNDGWKDYVVLDGDGAGQLDLTATARTPFIDNPDIHTVVQARSVDISGNISALSAYTWADQPRPVAALTAPSDGATNLPPASTRSLSLSFSQEIDISDPGNVTITKTSTGGSDAPALSGGAITANDTRWNAGHNILNLPLSGIEYGASYQVEVSDFTNTENLAQASAQTFTFSTIARAATPQVSINYAADALVLPAANTAYLVNGTSRTSNANSQIALAATGSDAYDWHGQTVRVVTAGNATTADSAPADVVIPARPAAPQGLSGYANKIYGVTTEMEYATSATGPFTAVTAVTIEGSDTYLSVSAGTYYVRYKAVTTSGSEAFASTPATVIVDDRAVSLNLTAPVFGADGSGRIEQGASVAARAATLTATGNISASFAAAEVTLDNTTDFELVAPAGTTTLEAGEQNMGISIRPKDNLAIGVHTATLSVTYHPEGKGITHTATATVQVTVTEKKPVPQIDYAHEQITGLVGSVDYLVDGIAQRTTSQGTISIDSSWFGRGTGATAPLSLIKSNTNTLLSSDAANLVIKTRPVAPAATAYAESFIGFADGSIEGVWAESMEYSNNGGLTWVSDIAALANFDAAAHRLYNLAPGSNYRLRYKATTGEQGNFASFAQPLTIATGSTEPTWGISLDTAQDATYSFAGRTWGYAAAPSHALTVANTGNQPTGALSVALSGDNPGAFSVSQLHLASLAPQASTSDIIVSPNAGLAAGTYTATLTVSGTQSGQGGHTQPFLASYLLSFTVSAATITGFSALDSWIAGKAHELGVDRDTVDEIANILLNGTAPDAPENTFTGVKTVSANLDSGAVIEVPISAWTNTGALFNPDTEGSYTFAATLDLSSFGSNLTHTSSLAPTLTVIVNELPYGILLDAQGTLTFAEAQYGYAVGLSANGAQVVAAHDITITNIGRKPTAEMNVVLGGSDPSAFELVAAGVAGATATIPTIVAQNESATPFSVRPKAGLVPGSYTATVVVSGQNGIAASVDVSFAVSPNAVTGFLPFEVPGGNVGYVTSGFEAENVAATLLALHPTVTATCTNGTVAYPVSAWTLQGAYDTEVAGSYTFVATLGDTPGYHSYAGGLSATLTVVIAPTTHAATPLIGVQPQGGEVYTAAADPAHELSLSVSAQAPDAASGGALSYQWYTATAPDGTGGQAIVGATDASYTPERNAVATTYYYCVVTNTNTSVNGEKTAQKRSAVATVSVVKRAQTSAVVITDPGQKAVKAGPYTFTLQATGGEGTGAISFRRTAGKDSVATVAADGTVTVYGAGQVIIVAQRASDSDWLAGSDSAEFVLTIAKNAPDVSAPSGLTAPYGTMLSGVSLAGFLSSGGTNNVPGTWSWEAASPALTRVGTVGTQTHLATFTPSDMDNNVPVLHVGVDILVSARLVSVDMSGLFFASKHFDGLTSVAVTGAPVLSGAVAGDNVSLVTSGVSYAFADASIATGKTVECTGDFSLSGSAAANYTLMQPAMSITNAASITAGFEPQEGVHFTSTPLNAGWTKDDFVITAVSGYALSMDASASAAGPWTTEPVVVASSAVTDGTVSFFVRRVGDAVGSGQGAIARYEISQQKTLTFGIDRAAPTATVQYGSDGFREFLNSITFGLFFKDTTTITIASTDTGGSDVETVSYYRDYNPSAELSASALEGVWQTYGSSLSAAPNAKFALYVKVVDKAGNFTTYKDGVVIYTDSVPDTQSVNITRFTSVDQNIYVTLQGNTIAGLERTSYVAPGDDSPLVNTSASGSAQGAGRDNAATSFALDTDYSISGNALVLKGSYLTGLKAGTHTFTVSYNPLGESYKPDNRGVAETDTNEAPATTTFTVVVSKAPQAAPSVSGAGLVAGAVSLAREAGDYTLTASGGEGTGGFVWESSDEDVATVAGSTSGGGITNATGTVTFTGDGAADAATEISVYRAGDEDYADSAAITVALTIQAETTPPVAGAQGLITSSDVSETGVTLTWTKATDAFPQDSELTYYIYQAQGISNTIATLDGIEAGTLTPLNQDGDGVEEETGVDTLTYAVTGLTADTPYWFNVVVVDAAGNKAAYVATAVITPLEVSFTAEQVGGTNGKVASSGILITFDKPVAGFVEFAGTGVSVSGAAGKNGATSIAGDHDGRVWLVPIKVIANNEAATVTMTGGTWTAADGHIYIVTNEDSKVDGVVVYKPVPKATPAEAAIDFANAHIVDLVAGETYRFQHGEGGTFGSAVSAATLTDATGDFTGYYNHIPFSTFGYWLGVQRMAAAAEAYVDSEIYYIYVPERPGTPQVSVTSPAAANDKGTISITDPDVSKTYEYCSVSSTGVESAWIVFDAAAGISDLDGGRYRIRIQATASSFASDFVTATVHAFDEVRFNAQLEGYELLSAGLGDGSDTSPQLVKLNPAFTITGVTFASNIGEGGDAFVISHENNSTEWYIQPGDELEATFDSSTKTVSSHTYHAQITITYEDNDDNADTATQDVWFTVHPKVEFESVEAHIDTTTGLTNEVEVTFAYPTQLGQGDLRVAGAAVRTGVNNITVSDNLKTYTIPVVPKGISGTTSQELAEAIYKTGDDIEVWAGITNISAYAVQASTLHDGNVRPPAPTDSEDTRLHDYPTVTIPRAIQEAHIVPVIEGYSSGVLQFTLDHEKSPISPDALVWYGTSDPDGMGYLNRVGAGEVKIEQVDEAGNPVVDPALALTINGVVKVDADEGYTYRVLFEIDSGVAQGSYSVRVSIPGFGVLPSKLEGSKITKTDKAIALVDYFLGTSGNNFPTDKDTALQILNPEDAGGAYSAPVKEFRLSKEFSDDYNNASNATVYFDGKIIDVGTNYEFVDGGAGTYIFDHVHKDDFTNQLALRLLSGWMTENGTHTIHIIFDNDAAGMSIAQGSLEVKGITKTYPLEVTDGTGGTGTKVHSANGIPQNTAVTAGAYAAERQVTLVAGTPNEGYKFESWTQIAGASVDAIPTTSTAVITMPTAEALEAADTPGVGSTSATPLVFRPNYTDGVAPVTAITPESGWLAADGKVTLTATDADVTATGGLGTVVATCYTVDGGAEKAYSGPFVLSALFDAENSPLAEGTHTIHYWSVDAADNIEEVKSATIGLDKTAPTAQVSVRGISRLDFSVPSGFSHFYKASPGAPVVITDTDAHSGVAKVEYLLHDFSSGVAAFANEDAAIADTSANWTTVSSGSASLTLTTPGKYIVYARVTDNAGNVRVANSAGIVIYSDGPVTESASYTKTSPVGVSVGLGLASSANTVASVEKSGSVPAILTLGASNDYTLTSDGIAFTATYLNSLSAGSSHSFKVSYYPRGVAYNTSLPTSEEPATTTIVLTVTKAASTLSLAVSPDSPPAYGTDNVTLTATVSGGQSGAVAATGTGAIVNFYDDPDGDSATPKVLIASEDVTVVEGAARASATITLAAGNHNLSASYAGSEYLAASQNGVTVNYTVSKAPSTTAPTISYDNAEVGGTDSPIAATYGDLPLELTAQGAAGTGVLQWWSSDASVAEVANSGRVLIKAAGSATIYVKRLADTNYGESPVASVVLNIAPRAVTLANLGSFDRVYDGTLVAPLTGTPTLQTVDADTMQPLEQGLGPSALSPLAQEAAQATIAADVSSGAIVLTVGTAAFASPDAEQDKPVTLTGFALLASSPKFSSYTFVLPTVTGSITPRPVIASGVSAADKSYDKTLGATIVGADSAVFDEVLPADASYVSLDTSHAQATFASADVDSAVPVSFSDFALMGARAHNYELAAQPADTTAAITPAALTVAHAGASPALAFGDALSAAGSGLDGLGYLFAGVADDADISGALTWDNAALIPGAPGYETSQDALGTSYYAKDDGVYYATAVFSPQAPYATNYTPLRFLVPVTVLPSETIRTQLIQDITQARTAVLGIYRENYAEDTLAALDQLLFDTQVALNGPSLSQGAVESLTAAFEAALSVLVHDHQVIEHSALEGITDSGVGVTVRFKGHFGSVSAVLFNGVQLRQVKVSDTSYELWAGGVFAGTLTAGSAIVTLTSEFVDTLDDGAHTLHLRFDDNYGSGTGSTTFTITRPAPAAPDALDTPVVESELLDDDALDAEVAALGQDADKFMDATTTGGADTTRAETASSVGVTTPLLIVLIVLVALGLLGAAATIFMVRRRRSRL